MEQYGSASELLGASTYSKVKLLKGFPNFCAWIIVNNEEAQEMKIRT